MTGVRALGVDAAGASGWVGVVVDDGGFVQSSIGSLTEVIESAEPIAVIGVDIPIGNLPGGGRLADREARAFVGPRGSSVFNAPPLESLAGDSYAEVNRRLEATGHPKMSRQAWALGKRVTETDGVARSDHRIIEVHPEVSFRALAGIDVRWSKKTWNGQTLRRALLAGAGIEIPDELGNAGGVLADDVLDAAVVGWSARRYARGEALALPTSTEVDDTGRRLAIWY